MLLFTSISIFSKIATSQSKTDLLFRIDTLFKIDYGDQLYMELNEIIYEGNKGHIFTANNDNVLVYETDGAFSVYDKQGVLTKKTKIPFQLETDFFHYYRVGKYTNRKKFPFINPTYIDDIACTENQIVLFYAFKIYILDNHLRVTDSLDYPENRRFDCNFTINDTIFLKYTNDDHLVMKLNLPTRTFETIPYDSIWGNRSAKCNVVQSQEAYYDLNGASSYLIIGDKTNPSMISGFDPLTLFNVKNCTKEDLHEFPYQVYPPSGWDRFVFINDTTAVFTVLYYNDLRPWLKPCYYLPVIRGLFPRDLVFYKINFPSN
jgi:hypothetical protein